MARPDIPSARWVGPPASYTRGRKTGQPSVIFIHTTEGGESRTSAEDGAAYDKSRTDGTSTHLFVDPDSTTQEVEFRDEAHAARSHGNDVGIQIEVCGHAAQTTAQWHDPNSTAILTRLIRACFEIRALYGKARFPLVNLTPARLRAGEYGFAEHYDATKAWPEDGGTHSDPGPNFPWAELFAGIRELETPKAEDDMDDAQIGKLAAATGKAVVDELVTRDLGKPGGGDTIGIVLQSGVLGNSNKLVEAIAETNAKLAELVSLLTPPVQP